MTENTYDNIDDLLVKVVLGEATGDELNQVGQWIALSSANGKYFEDFKRIWEESKHLEIRSTVDENEMWRHFQRRVQESAGVGAGEGSGSAGAGEGSAGAGEGSAGAGERSPGAGERSAGVGGEGKVRRFSWGRVAAAAAVVVLVAGGWLFYYSQRPAPMLAVHAVNQVLTDTLPEGSVVTLNKESSIRYDKHFSGATRGVEMEGEPFFSVVADKNKPFVVQAGGARITVLGTSFNVKIMPDSTEVIVETGMVEVTNGGAPVGVRAHERVIIGRDGGVRMKDDDKDKLYNYYRTKEFECDGTPLWRLVEKLNEVYNAHVMIGDERLKDLPVTVTFQDESLDTILNILVTTFKSYGMTIERQGGDIIIKSK